MDAYQCFLRKRCFLLSRKDLPELVQPCFIHMSALFFRCRKLDAPFSFKGLLQGYAYVQDEKGSVIKRPKMLFSWRFFAGQNDGRNNHKLSYLSFHRQ